MIESIKRVHFIDMHVGITTNAMGIFGKATTFSASCNYLLPTMGSYIVMKDALILIFNVKYTYYERLFNLHMLWWHFSILSCHVTWVQLFILWLFHGTYVGGYNIHHKHMGGYKEEVGILEHEDILQGFLTSPCVWTLHGHWMNAFDNRSNNPQVVESHNITANIGFSL